MSKVYLTGANGRAGQYILRDLLSNGYEVVGVDKNPPNLNNSFPETGFFNQHPVSMGSGYTFKYVDVTDFGQVVSTMKGCDAVIHMAAIPNPLMAPEHEVFRVNLMSNWNILESAEIYQIKNIVMASSINAVGAVFSKGINARPYFPIDEEHPTFAEDSYSQSKWIGEIMADSFVRRSSGDLRISSMRFSGLMDKERSSNINKQNRFLYKKEDKDSMIRNAKNFWSWSDIEESARACVLSLEADFFGHEAFFINSLDTISNTKSEELIKTFYPESEIKKDLGDYETLISVDKAIKLLGWDPQATWRK
tara:strand:+ start:1192 stop:2112 length:921 start_codon:yes stop_codon:yes gene_type:complete